MSEARFSAQGFRRGLLAALPILPSLIPFGLVVGLESAARGLSLAEAGLMSLLVFAGTAQLVALGAWADPVPLLAVTLAALVVNLRMAPMTAALAPLFHGQRGLRVWATLFTVTDHSFALGVRELRAGGRDGAFLLGIGLPTWLFWTLCVTAGHVLSGAVALSPQHPLLFAGLASMAALVATLWRGPGDVLPWGVAGAVGLAIHALSLPQPWPVLAGALAGSAAGAWRDGRR
ncbi:MAG: AzlC family ABC transporter permease [Rhodovarius sp.]|nr:AzlC family ABC transporter permease [Rhodovarius sp.]MCX7933440.1 AzlC family ABC transporter permease [Rhodovarius sp.]MDW8315694.1 AzlC family ABC transporter permease [Rhodovarius sp.]